MELTKDFILFYDLEILFKKANKVEFIKESKGEEELIKLLLKEAHELKVSFDNFELSFLDTKIINDTFMNTMNRIILGLKKQKIIKRKEDILRDMSGYFIYKENIFSGVKIKKPSIYFGEENIFYPKYTNSTRSAQALIRYPDKIAKMIRAGKQFCHIINLNPKELAEIGFVPSKEDLIYFEDFIYIENSKTKCRSYFGVWD